MTTIDEITIGPVLIVVKVVEDSNSNAFKVVPAHVENIFERYQCSVEPEPFTVRSATVRTKTGTKTMDLEELFPVWNAKEAHEHANLLKDTYFDD